MATFFPYPAEMREARTPPDPPPITTRSYSSSSLASELRVRDRLVLARVDKARSGAKAEDLMGARVNMRARELMSFIVGIF